MSYLDPYTAQKSRRLEVRPGIAGWAHLSECKAVGWDRRFELDVWYVDHWALRLDLKLLWLIAIEVSRRTGISELGHATMREFTGTPEAE